VIAEQFGTLEALHPGRIDLGLGRAPGSDQDTMFALRRNPMSAESFPEDVLELQGYLTGKSRIPGIDATPGKGANVPLYILGSSLFGANLAASLGLPYAFASHFAPDALQEAVATYRREFRPSSQLDRPYVIAGVNVIAADTTAEAQAQFLATQRSRVTLLFGQGEHSATRRRTWCLRSPAGQHVQHMLTFPPSARQPRSESTSRPSPSMPMRTSSSSPTSIHDGSHAPLGGTARRLHGARTGLAEVGRTRNE